MKTVRRVGIRSLCRMVFCADLCLLLVTALPFAVLAAVFRLYASLPRPYSPIAVLAATLVLHPLAAALVAAFGGWLYNKLAPRIGGVQVELD